MTDTDAEPVSEEDSFRDNGDSQRTDQINDQRTEQTIEQRTKQRTRNLVRDGVLIIAIGLLIVAGGLALFSIRHLLLLSTIAIGLGALISPLFPHLKKHFRIPYGFSAALILLTLLALLLGGSAWLSFILATEVAPFVAQVPLHVENGLNWLSGALNEYPGIQESIDSFRIDMQSYVPTLTLTVLSGLRTGGWAIIDGLFVIAIGLYTAVDIDRYRRGLLAAFPSRVRTKVDALLGDLGSTLRYWFYAQLVVMSGVAIMTAGTLFLIGIENWIAYALLAGFLDIIPYVGPFLSAGILVLVSLGYDPQLTIWILLAFTAIQQIEAYLLMPVVMKGRVEIPPIYLLITIFVMTQWFGLLGAFAATPILALARRILLLTYIPHMDRKVAVQV